LTFNGVGIVDIVLFPVTSLIWGMSIFYPYHLTFSKQFVVRRPSCPRRLPGLPQHLDESSHHRLAPLPVARG
jgi:hypothetical protein